jgi:hypothetical protein
MARVYGQLVGGPGSGNRMACDLPKGGQDQYNLLLAISKETAYEKYIVYLTVLKKVFVFNNFKE